MGHRNVQGLAWDSRGRLWATEFGQDTFDEVNLIEPGGNYGWPEVEGVGDDDRFINPKVTWSTDEASPSGLAIAGDTLYVAALRGQRLWTIPLSGDGLGKPEAELDGQYGRLRNVHATSKRTPPYWNSRVSAIRAWVHIAKALEASERAEDRELAKRTTEFLRQTPMVRVYELSRPHGVRSGAERSAVQSVRHPDKGDLTQER
jgi:hypothetical protein